MQVVPKWELKVEGRLLDEVNFHVCNCDRKYNVVCVCVDWY